MSGSVVNPLWEVKDAAVFPLKDGEYLQAKIDQEVSVIIVQLHLPQADKIGTRLGEVPTYGKSPM